MCLKNHCFFLSPYKFGSMFMNMHWHFHPHLYPYFSIGIRAILCSLLVTFNQKNCVFIHNGMYGSHGCSCMCLVCIKMCFYQTVSFDEVCLVDDFHLFKCSNDIELKNIIFEAFFDVLKSCTDEWFINYMSGSSNTTCMCLFGLKIKFSRWNVSCMSRQWWCFDEKCMKHVILRHACDICMNNFKYLRIYWINMHVNFEFIKE